VFLSQYLRILWARKWLLLVMFLAGACSVTALPTPTELPPTLSELQRGTVDATYLLSSRVSIGLSYWYEKYTVHDFTLDIDANPQLVRGQALLIGYLYQPYTANTVWGRVVYRW